jgi:hypothetical protein
MRLDHSAIPDSLDQLREAAEAMPRPGCDWERRPEFLSPPTLDQLEQTKRALAVPLPDDLSNFLALCGGIQGMSVHNGYRVCGASDIVQFNSHSDGWPPNVVSTASGTERVLTIALDGGGNAFLLSPRLGNVWRWDHETGKTIRVAESFSGFLHRVAEDWAAYVEQKEGWTYLV